jgi:DNA-binding helix-hairpin-helix protein with protein kinase domain
MPTAGSIFKGSDGCDYRYESELGDGGQAVVWKVTRINNGEVMAFKLFKNAPTGEELSKQHQRLNKVITVAQQIADSMPAAQVCYPRVVHSANGEFGVWMDLAAGKLLNHRSLLVNPQDQPDEFQCPALDSIIQRKSSYHHFLLAAFRLSRAVAVIHSHGMTHCDLSLGNVFMDPADGSISIIDCDNLACGDYLPPKVAGTPGFRAPELMGAQPSPTIESDRHSLAVLLFYLSMLRHPFVGSMGPDCNPTGKTEEEAFGKKAIFTDHPNNKGNRFKGGLPFEFLPSSLRQMFVEVFTEGLVAPTLRHTARVWAREFWQALECMTLCTLCKQRFFINDKDATCLFCNATNRRERWWLKFSDGRKMLAEPGRKLYDHHLQGKEFSFENPLAELRLVDQIINIKNLSNHDWVVHTAAGATLRCSHGQAFRFNGVTSFDYGNGRATIEQVQF